MRLSSIFKGDQTYLGAGFALLLLVLGGEHSARADERYDSSWRCRWLGQSKEFPVTVKGRTIRACKGVVRCRHPSMRGGVALLRDVFYCEARDGLGCNATECLRSGDTRELSAKVKADLEREIENATD
jgi:hypothetical protein